MKAYKLLLDQHLGAILPSYKDALALYVKEIESKPITEMLTFQDKNNPVLFWQLQSLLLECYSSEHPPVQQIEHLFLKLRDLDASQCDALLNHNASLDHSSDVSLLELLLLVHAYNEYAESGLDLTIPNSTLPNVKPEYLKLLALMQVLKFSPDNDPMIIKHAKAYLDKVSIDPILWDIKLNNRSPINWFISALTSKKDGNLLRIGKQIEKIINPNSWIMPNSKGATPLLAIASFLHKNPSSKELIGFLADIEEKNRSSGLDKRDS